MYLAVQNNGPIDGRFLPSIIPTGIRFHPFLRATVSIPSSELLGVDFGAPLHSLVICGTTHPLEDELLKWHRVQKPPTPAEGSELAEEVEGGERAEEAGGGEGEGAEGDAREGGSR